MPKLEGFETSKQYKEKSCWACVARTVINWFNGETYKSDQELAEAWAKSSNKRGVKEPITIDNYQSAIGAIEDLSKDLKLEWGRKCDYTSGSFDEVMATPDEIKEDIEKGFPLVALVGTKAPEDGKPKIDAQKGHFVVITGIEKEKIEVFDPDDGIKTFIDYDAKEYKHGRKNVAQLFWQVTSTFAPPA